MNGLVMYTSEDAGFFSLLLACCYGILPGRIYLPAIPEIFLIKEGALALSSCILGRLPP